MEVLRLYDPEATQAAKKSAIRCKTVDGIDVNNTRAAEASVSAALSKAQQDRSEAESQQTKAAAARTAEVMTDSAVARAHRQEANGGGIPQNSARAPEHSEVAATLLNERTT